MQRSTATAALTRSVSDMLHGQMEESLRQMQEVNSQVSKSDVATYTLMCWIGAMVGATVSFANMLDGCKTTPEDASGCAKEIGAVLSRYFAALPDVSQVCISNKYSDN